MYYLKSVNKETARHLVDMARNYSEDEYYRYVCEVGFEDWMEEFIDGEEVTEREGDEINKVLKEAFELSKEQRLKAERKLAGLTQAQMAEEFGIPKRTIENWESGTRTAPEYVERLIIDKLRSKAKL